MDLAERLASLDVVGHWEFVCDYNESYACGQILALSDGTLLKRMGGSSSRGDGAGAWSTTWRYTEWEVYMDWEGDINPKALIEGLKGRGYDLAEPSPVPLDRTEAGPFDGIPNIAKYL
jgi:hypothetical protein